MIRSLIPALVLSSLAFGQIDSNAVTVTASRNANLQPDTVLFSVTVTSGFNAGLDDILAALAGSGITAANLSNVSSQPGILSFNPGPGIITIQPAQSGLQWTFTLPVPLSKLKDTIASLTTLQQTIAQKNPGMSMTFSVQGTQASPQQCSTPDLISDARAQAQKLANAAGVSVGPIIGVADAGSSSVTAVAASRIPTPLAGDFSALVVNTPLFAIAPTLPLNCSLVVQFRMQR